MAAALHVAEVVGDEASYANLFTMARGATNDEREQQERPRHLLSDGLFLSLL